MSAQIPTILYTPNKYSASIGVLCTVVDGKEITSIIEVLQQKGRSVYCYMFENAPSNGITRVDAEAMWDIAAESYGAIISEVDGKFMNAHFKELLKPYLAMRKEERRIDKEVQKFKEQVKLGEEVDVVVTGSLFD